MPVTGLDHVVITTDDGARLGAFYRRLGISLDGFDRWQRGEAEAFAIVLGDQKINVHPETVRPWRRHPDFLGSRVAVPGGADLCVVWRGGVQELVLLLASLDLPVETGPVLRRGGRDGGAEGVSVYVRDPDQNLLELISYDEADVRAARDEGRRSQSWLST